MRGSRPGPPEDQGAAKGSDSAADPQARPTRPGRPGGVRVFSHTADTGLAVRGRSLEDLCHWAGVGLARVVLGGRLPPGPPGRAVPGESGREVRVASPVEVPVEIPPAPDPEGILVNWLTFLIILLETEGLVYHWGDLTVRGVAAELTLTGTVLAWRPGPGSLRRPVKAATYHGLAVTTDRQGVRRARIILDV